MSSLNETTKVLPGGTAPLETQESHEALRLVDGDFTGSPRTKTLFSGHGTLRAVNVLFADIGDIKVRDGAKVLGRIKCTAAVGQREVKFDAAILESLIIEAEGAGGSLGNTELSATFL